MQGDWRLLQVFAAEFAGGWLGFWTAPEVLSYGLIWSNFPGGTWEYRWGDQQFWKSALGLFDDGSHVEDVSYVRSAHPMNTPYSSRSCKVPPSAGLKFCCCCSCKSSPEEAEILRHARPLCSH